MTDTPMTNQRPLLPVTQSDRNAAAKALGYRNWSDATDYRLTGRQDRERDALVQAFAAYRHRLTAEQDGWVRVPVEPTGAMIDRFVSRALCVSVHGDGGWSNYAREQWRVMIAAAPPANILDSTKEAGL